MRRQLETLLAVAMLLVCLALHGCIQPRPSGPGRPASVRQGQNWIQVVWRVAGFPLLEAGVMLGLDFLRPKDAATVAEPQEEF